MKLRANVSSKNNSRYHGAIQVYQFQTCDRHGVTVAMERGGAEHAASRASVGGTRFAPALSALSAQRFLEKDSVVRVPSMRTPLIFWSFHDETLATWRNWKVLHECGLRRLVQLFLYSELTS